MDATTSPHPTDQALSGYGLGRLDDGSAGAVGAHLRECSRCRDRMAAISGSGPPAPCVPAQALATVTYGGPSPSGWPGGDALDPGLARHPDYEIKRELGRGGMGVVYLAHNKLMGRDEVLKVMGPHIVDHPGVFERFLREIRAVARLRHENIVTAYSAARIGEGVAFAMEYVEGLDLSRMVRAKGPLPVAHACNFACQAALGLQHAHEEGLVHRDIKPGNLMLTRKGRKATIKVLDFGLAKVAREGSLAEPITSEGQALGTPDFIAPEQISSAQTVDIRADIYSLGATLYYLLTGRPPFKARSLYAMFQAHLSSEPDPLDVVRPDVPPGLAAVVARMMAKDPAMRFQTPREVAQALRPFFQEGGAAFKGPDAVLSASGGLNGPSPAGGPAGAPVTRADSSTTPEVRWESLIAFHDDDDPGERTREASGPAGRPGWVWPSVAVGVLILGLLVVLFGIVLRVRTDQGDLVFDGLPDDAVVRVDGQVVEVEWPGSDAPARVSVAAGGHSVQVEVKGVEVAGHEVKIGAGDRKWIKVRLVPTVADRPEGKTGPEERPRPLEVAATRPESPAGSPTTSPAPTRDQPPSTSPPAAAGASDILHADTFDDPGSGWPREDPNAARKVGDPYHYGYSNGVYFNSGAGSAQWSEPGPFTAESEFQLRLVGRILDATPESRGRWTVHIRPADPRRRGFQVAVERNGVLALEPSFWDKTPLPGDPRIGPVVLHGFRAGTEFNTLELRVRRRQVEILCNGVRACPPISYDWDLTPSLIHLGVDGYAGSYRAEFDRIEVRKLAGEPAGPVARVDPLRRWSVWRGEPGHSTFTVLEREGERIKARFSADGRVGEVDGTIKEGRLRWSARDVKAISGGTGGDHEGEVRGDEIAMTWSDPGGLEEGRFTLRLSEPAPPPPDAGPGSPVARTPNLLFFDEFDDSRTGWDQEDPKEPGAVIHGHGYRNGAFFLANSGPGQWSYPCARDFGGDFQVEVSGRVLDATPESSGRWTVHVIPKGPGLRGVQVGIDRSGVLVREPTFWHKNDAAGDPRTGRISIRNFRRGNRFNTLTLRVKGRQLEALVNSTRVGPIITFGWDLSPAALHLGLDAEAGSTRAEFDRIEVKELPNTQAAEPRRR